METELIVRLGVVLAAVAIVVAVARLRPRRRPAPLRVEGNLEGPGVYLFTSAGCDSCEAARSVYRDVLGDDGFTELSWDDQPALLSRLGVEEIPTGTVLDASGREVAAYRLIPPRRSLARAARSVRETEIRGT